MEHRGRGAALSARPWGVPAAAPATPGTHALTVEAQDDSVLCVPPRPQSARPVPLLVALHGAGGLPRGSLPVLQTVADQYGTAVLVPVSREATWDGIHDDYGPDVDVIDRSLRRAFDAVPVDPARIGIAGFSDGASYALGLGLANGDVFGHIIAFSPGFIPPAARRGHPRVLVSHGVTDPVLPIDRTSRRIVPALRHTGYDVTYLEFDGAHTIPRDIALEAAAWLGWNDMPTGSGPARAPARRTGVADGTVMAAPAQTAPETERSGPPTRRPSPGPIPAECEWRGAGTCRRAPAGRTGPRSRREASRREASRRRVRLRAPAGR